jgi:tetratricopeptide (TPR) repeat protein
LLVLIAAIGLSIPVLGWLGWSSLHRRSVREHWDAVARGRAYLDQGRPDLALNAVFDVRDEAPGSGEGMTVAGLAMLRLGEYSGARLALERALKLQPNQFDAAMTLAELNLALGNGQRGIELLETAARLRPREFRVHFTMAKVHNDRGDVSRAISEYEKAVALNPDHRASLIGLIGAMMRSVRPDQADPWVAKALVEYPDDPSVLGLAAAGAFNANRLDEANALADRALAREPRNVRALVARARCQLARSHCEQALPDAELAVAVEPNNTESIHLLFEIETTLGLTERAASTLVKRKQAQDRLRLMNDLAEEITRNPDDPQLPWKMGRAALDSGMTVLARRCFEAALALDTNFQPARESLAALLASEPDRARLPGRTTSFRRAIGMAPPSTVSPP